MGPNLPTIYRLHILWEEQRFNTATGKSEWYQGERIEACVFSNGVVGWQQFAVNGGSLGGGTTSLKNLKRMVRAGRRHDQWIWLDGEPEEWTYDGDS